MSDTMQVREWALTYRARTLPIRVPRDGVFSTPSTVARWCGQIVPDHVREHFVCISLDGRHQLAGYQIVSTGTLTSSLVHPREVFRAAIIAGAAALIVAHNHPSGVPTPSAEDYSIATRLMDAGKVLGIQLLDSIIFTDNEALFHSMKERDW